MHTDENQPGSSTNLAAAVVGIVGLGLMGGSLALALKGHCARLVGIDHDPAAVALALERKVVEDASTDPVGILADVDLIILAVPVRASLVWLKRLPEIHPKQAVVIDLGSTKRAVVEAMQALPDHFDPLGGHPMCGKEVGTLQNAEADLFFHARFALSALPRTSPRACQIALELVSCIGARPLWIDAAEHDRWVAATSHLPHLIATALVLGTPPATAPLAGTGFHSTSRLAAGSAEMKADIFATNRQPVLQALNRFRQQLDIIETALETNNLESLQHMLAQGAEQRLGYLSEIS